MKYRKKPVVIEAMQFNGDNAFEIMDWAHNGMPPEANSIILPCFRSLSIRTLEGTMVAAVDDFVIRGIKGEFYPCKPDIFVATYEKVE